MTINPLELKAQFENKKLNKRIAYFKKLISELDKRTLPDSLIDHVNAQTALVMAASHSEKELQKQIRKSIQKVLTLAEREAKLVGKRHYQTRWLAVGMAAFGIPMGVAFGTAIDNMGMIGVGMPIGMAIGIALGTQMDAKAKNEGRQMDLESMF